MIGESRARSASRRMAGFSTTGILDAGAEKTVWRNESISICGGSVSGLHEVDASAAS